MKKKLAIVTTHPIQYYAPWFKLLAKRDIIQIKIFYTWSQTNQGAKYDPGFGKKVEWDIPLLDGYDYTFVQNISSDPGSHHFKGIVNPTLINDIKQWSPDALLVIGWSFQSHLKCMRYFHKKIPVLFRGDSTLLDKQNSLKAIIRSIFLKWVYNHIDYALYVGSNNKNYYLKYGLKDKQLIFAPHAIDNDRFAEPNVYYEKEAFVWKKELGIKNEDLVILFAGKLEPKKNPAVLYTIAKNIKNENIKFIFAGNGILEDELKEITKSDGRFLFIGFQNQMKMPITYRLGDMFILPSKGPGETWGLAINEAMASSRPVIISNKVGCGSDLVKNNMNGLIYDIDNTGTLINFIKRVLEKEISLAKMGAESANIIKNFEFNRIATAIEDLLIRL